MQIHNPTSQSRYCHALERHLEPFQVVELKDEVERCAGCECVVSPAEHGPSETPAQSDEEPAFE